MEFVQLYAKELVALIVPFLTWALNSRQRGEAKLVHGVRHSYKFLVNQPLINEQGTLISSSQLAHTASVVIQNLGRKTATNVELVFNFRPMCVNFWPLRSRTEKPQEDGRLAYVFDSLAPGEVLGVELLSVNNDLPGLVHVRCDQGVANGVHLVYSQAAPLWAVRLRRTYMFVGIGAMAYMALLLIQFLVLKTPAVLGS